jgi:hypothetical protein
MLRETRGSLSILWQEGFASDVVCESPGATLIAHGIIHLMGSSPRSADVLQVGR